MIRHVVLLRFLDEAAPDRCAAIAVAFEGLASKISQVRYLEWGLNASPEGLDKGFTHCFLVTFDGEADRDVYLSHPAHQAFVGELKLWLADVLVVDYALP